MRATLIGCALACWACGAGDVRETESGGGEPGGSSGEGGATSQAANVASVGTGSGGAAELTPEVFANSQTTLYRLDPIAKTIAPVGDFDCVVGGGDNQFGRGMADIALDATGQMYGVGATAAAAPGLSPMQGLVMIDKATAACSVVADVGELVVTGLTFLPAEGAGAETLVGLVRAGLTDTAYVSFDPVSGQMTTLGGFGATWFATSPDVVAIEGDRTYATAYPNFSPEHLLAIDPVSGLVDDDLGNLDLNGVTGMGYWGGTVYLFMHSGALWAVEPASAQKTAIPIPNLPAGTQFWGAGVTTVAPTLSPK